MTDLGYEHVSFFHDAPTGLQAIISIHNTKLGPALGGTRFYSYASEDHALDDVLNLSRGMTFKASLAGLNLGGGKAVILGDAKKIKTKELLLAYGRCVERLAGKYITSVDSGTTAQDMDVLKEVTKHVVGSTQATGGSEDPSPMTALGVFEGIKASAQFIFGSPSLKDKTIAVSGVGNVGHTLVKHLASAGAKLMIADVNQEKLESISKELGAQIVPLDKIEQMECDVYSPNALGGAINSKNVDLFKCKIIAGAANNQLADKSFAQVLKSKNILYAPDYAINAGGLISVASETSKFSKNEVLTRTKAIYQTLLTIFERSKAEDQTTDHVAELMAKERLK